MAAERAILHSDMNSFYASVEMMLNPSLRGKAVAVCGSTESRHGIVLAKSQLAKKAGVKTGMVNWEARQCCPGLILVPPHYDEYLIYSELAHNIYYRYTDLVEPFGMDECWLDVSDSLYSFGTAHNLAEDIRQAVKTELGLTVSIGVSFNKVFAKLGSDMKKPDAVTDIPKESFRELVWPLSADEMIYVGRATARKLHDYGFNTLGDVAGADPEFLKSILGINGYYIWQNANGLDTSRVAGKDYVFPLKTIGHGITCSADLVNSEEVWRVMLELSQDVGHRLRVHKFAAKGVELSVRCNDLYGYQYQCSLPIATQLPSEIAAGAFRLFEERYRWQKDVRAVCVRAIDLVPQDRPQQMDMFTDVKACEKLEHVQDAVEEIRARFGKRAITYCSIMGGLKMPDDGRDKVRMPNIMYS